MPKLRPLTCDWRGADESGDCHEPATFELIDREERDADGPTYTESLGCFCPLHAVMALEDALRTDRRMLGED